MKADGYEKPTHADNIPFFDLFIKEVLDFVKDKTKQRILDFMITHNSHNSKNGKNKKFKKKGMIAGIFI